MIILNKRDKAIIHDLQQFRVLDRNQIVELHFKELKGAINHCNRVMGRLVTKGEVIVDRDTKPFTYFPNPSTIKLDSTKIKHYKKIADFIIECSKYKKPTFYRVEAKLGAKGTVESDLIMSWLGNLFFVEIQNSRFTYKVMNEKLNRYKEYYDSGAWETASWQREKPVFPYIWIVSDFEYDLEKKPLTILQSENVKHFIKKYHNTKKES